MLLRNLIFDGMSGKITELMQETTSYLDNGYNVTSCFGCFEKCLAYTYSFQVSLLSGTKWQSYPGGKAFLSSIQYRGLPDPIQNRVETSVPPSE